MAVWHSQARATTAHVARLTCLRPYRVLSRRPGSAARRRELEFFVPPVDKSLKKRSQAVLCGKAPEKTPVGDILWSDAVYPRQNAAKAAHGRLARLWAV
jgi:hypothetical protein